MPRHVVTGAPGTGKTTVIALLGQRFVTVPEPARRVIASHQLETGETGLDHRPELFVARLLERSMQDFGSVAAGESAFFDRGVPDCVAYALASGVDTRDTLRAAGSVRYDDPVFLARPWEDIYTTDAMRRASFDQAAEFDALIETVYVDLGYTVVELPKVSAVERAAFIVTELGLELD